MSAAEKWAAMEALWQSVREDAESLEAPAWHAQVVLERLAKADSGAASFMTVEQAARQLSRG